MSSWIENTNVCLKSILIVSYNLSLNIESVTVDQLHYCAGGSFFFHYIQSKDVCFNFVRQTTYNT